MARPSKQQQTLAEIFEQFTSQLGVLVREKVTQAIAEATECFSKCECMAPEASVPAKPSVKAAPKRRRSRRRKAAKKSAAKTAASTPTTPETKAE
ncbi:MAG: hypothetical protein WC889_11305 [Myxococcota bacterium]|jgi:hypothetical protein